ncbi:MAG: hypothetical protein JWM27_3379 [Gemmatimonadetes bacterium]|nr:hypothetical protein [Gemmatimonadota bacterium]
MAERPPTPPVALQQAREQTIRALCEHFAADHLDDGELERRLDGVHRADTLDALRGLVSDLPALRPDGAPAGPPRPGMTMARPESVSPAETVIALMGAAKRAGSWTPPRHLHVFALMGGVELDFRTAALPPGVSEITIFAMMGGVEIVVPPGLHVEVNGMGVMGGFDHRAGVAPPTDPNAPVLRIGGFAVMGGVEIRSRYPGENNRDARLRERDERRQLRGQARRIKRGD